MPRRPWMAAGLLLTAACGRAQAQREEAARVNQHVEALIMSDRHNRAPLLEQLKATPCSLPDVCEARQACIEAFVPAVKAAALQAEARALLDRHDPALSAQVDERLDQAERLQNEARKQQEHCLAATTNLRQAHRL